MTARLRAVMRASPCAPCNAAAAHADGRAACSAAASASWLAARSSSAACALVPQTRCSTAPSIASRVAVDTRAAASVPRSAAARVERHVPTEDRTAAMMRHTARDSPAHGSNAAVMMTAARLTVPATPSGTIERTTASPIASISPPMRATTSPRLSERTRSAPVAATLS